MTYNQVRSMEARRTGAAPAPTAAAQSSLPEDEMDVLKSIALDFPDSTIPFPTQEDIADFFYLSTGRVLTRQRVAQLLTRIEVAHVHPRAKPTLDDFAIRSRDRLGTRVLRDPRQLDTIIFSDEKYFSLSDWTGGRRVYCTGPKDVRRFRQRDHKPKTVMVWGAISRLGGVALVAFPEGVMLNSDSYAELLYTHVQPLLDSPAGAGLFFQQDGAGSHDGNAAGLALSQLRRLTGWPAHSPEWSPIELIWASCAQIVRARYPQTVREMLQYLQEAWQAETAPAKIQVYYDMAFENIVSSARVGWGNGYDG